MKLTKVKIAIAAAILIPSSAFAYQASQPVEPEPVKVAVQEKKEVKVDEPESTPVEVEETVTPPVKAEDAEPIPTTVLTPAEKPNPEGWIVGTMPEGVERCKITRVNVMAVNEEQWQNILNSDTLHSGNPKIIGEMYQNATNGQYTCFVY